jgi:hypothetical protein
MEAKTLAGLDGAAVGNGASHNHFIYKPIYNRVATYNLHGLASLWPSLVMGMLAAGPSPLHIHENIFEKSRTLLYTLVRVVNV